MSRLQLSNYKENQNKIWSLSRWKRFLRIFAALLAVRNHERISCHRYTDPMLKELEEAGMQVSRPDTSTFQEATKSVYDEFYAENDWAKELVKEVQQIIDSVK